MKKNFLFLAATVLLFVTLGCSKRQDGPAVSTVKFNMTKSYLDKKAASFWVQVAGQGQWTLALEFPSTGTENQKAWAEFRDSAEGEGKGQCIEGEGSGQCIVGYDENTGKVGRKLSIVLYSDGKEVDRYSIMQRTDSYSPDPLPSWLELPEMKSKWAYHNHKYSNGSAMVRNYSYGWNASVRLSDWVAYPLPKKTPSASRKDQWAFDPKVDHKEQANCVTSSYRGRYDRGHQIPSADRRMPEEAQNQTCYMTNLTPQASAFNQGIWQKFEAQVRTWASYTDTLYVVTGCELSDNPSCTTDRDGNDCPIPSHYYKVLLVRGSNIDGIPAAADKPGAGKKWLAAAFRLEHRTDYDSEATITSDYMMSVSEFEEITGINFFVNLPAYVGAEAAAAIEKDNPKNRSFWFK